MGIPGLNNSSNEVVQTVCLAQIERGMTDNTEVLKELHDNGYDQWGYPVKTPPLGRQYKDLISIRPCEFKYDCANNPIIKKIEKPYQAQAAVVYTAGEVAAQPCDYCAEFKGAFQKCVTYTPLLPDGSRGKPFFKGACCNCRYHNKSPGCSFRKSAAKAGAPPSSNNTNQATYISGESSQYNTSISPASHHDQDGTNKRRKLTSISSFPAASVPLSFSQAAARFSQDRAKSVVSGMSWAGLGQATTGKSRNGLPNNPANHMSELIWEGGQGGFITIRGHRHELKIPTSLIGDHMYIDSTMRDMQFFLDCITPHLLTLRWVKAQSASQSER